MCGRNLVTSRLSAAAPAAPAACDVGGDPPEPRRGSAAWALTSSLDHLVGKLLELRWHIKAESRGDLRQDCCPLNASGRPTLPDQSRSLVVTDCTDVGRRPPRQINHDSLSTRWLTAPIPTVLKQPRKLMSPRQMRILPAQKQSFVCLAVERCATYFSFNHGCVELL
jgi:hypothetical protein